MICTHNTFKGALVFLLRLSVITSKRNVFTFLDYKDVPVEDSGWLVYKQDPENSMSLPLNYTICVHLYKWFSRLKYQNFATINLIDKQGKKTAEFTTAAAWDGLVAFTEFSQQVYSRPRTKVPFRALEWQHVCVNVDFISNTWKYYKDGVFVSDKGAPYTAKIFKDAGPKFNISDDQSFELVLGTYRTRPPRMAHRMIGMLYGFNMYTKTMDHQTLLDITGCRKEVPGDFINWEDSKWSKTNEELLSTTTLAFEEICVDKKEAYVYVIPHSIINQQMGLDRCQALSMRMVVPRSRVVHEKVLAGGNSEAMKSKCYAQGRQIVAFAMQHEGGRFYDPQTSEVVEYARDNMDWSIHTHKKMKKPGVLGTWMYTGRDYNVKGIDGEIGITAPNAGNYKYKEVCFACTGSSRPVLTVRGLCVGSFFDTEITFFIDSEGYASYYGNQRTHLTFDYVSNIWTLTSKPHPSAKATTKAVGNTLVLGSKTWIIENDRCEDKRVEKALKITSCRQNQFTCFDGRCIPISERCDSVNNCNDWSDEKGCNTIVLPESYFKEFPPFSVKGKEIQKVQVDVSFYIVDFVDVSETDKSIELKYLLNMQWIDLRVSFENLQEETHSNRLTERQKAQTWFPELTFSNTIMNEKVVMDGKTTMNIIRNGSFTYSGIDDVDEKTIYSGLENPLVYSRSYTKVFSCDFKLALYPFDTQICKVEMTLGKADINYINLLSKDIKMLGETELMKYTVKGWSIKKMNNGITVSITLGRKILNAFLTTYLPTILLMIIVHSTNYYKDFFFEAIVTVNLTGMLVLSTMFVSVSSNLPVTSDIKMIEVWLIFSLMVPFTEVLLQVSINVMYKAVYLNIGLHGSTQGR